MVQAVSSLRQSLKRLSFRRGGGGGSARGGVSGGKGDELSGKLAQFRGVTVAWLQELSRRVEAGEVGGDLALLELTENVEDLPKGTVAKVLADDGGSWRARVTSTPDGGSFKVRKEQARVRGRDEATLEDLIYLLWAEADERSYVEVVEAQGEAFTVEPRAFQGAYLCVPRSTPLARLVSGLAAECKRRNKKTDKQLVWLDVFGLNHARVLDATVDEKARLLSTLMQAIGRFEQRWVWIDSWDDPVAITRAWCAWEMYQMAHARSATSAPSAILAAGAESVAKGRVDAIMRTVQNQLFLSSSNKEAELLYRHTCIEDLKRTMRVLCEGWLAQSVIEALARERADVASNKLAGKLQDAADVVLFVLRDQLAAAAARPPLHLQHINTALRLYREAQDLYSKSKNDAAAASVATKLGAAHEGLQDHDMALKHYKRAFFIHKERNDALMVAKTLSKLANVWALKGKYDKALESYEQACLLMILVKDKDPLLVADTMVNTANVLAYQKKYDEALRKFEQALLIRREKLGSFEPAVADIINSMANVAANQNRLEDALKNYRKALDIYERAYGENHIMVFVTLNNIGVILNDLGEPEHALKVLEQAVSLVASEMQQRQLIRSSVPSIPTPYTAANDDAPDVATTYNNMAVCHEALRRYDKSFEKYKDALRACERTLGPSHPKCANIRLNIGISFLESQRKPKEALPHLQAAQRIYQQAYGDDHPDSRECKAMLRKCQAALG